MHNTGCMEWQWHSLRIVCHDRFPRTMTSLADPFSRRQSQIEAGHVLRTIEHLASLLHYAMMVKASILSPSPADLQQRFDTPSQISLVRLEHPLNYLLIDRREHLYQHSARSICSARVRRVDLRLQSGNVQSCRGRASAGGRIATR